MGNSYGGLFNSSTAAPYPSTGYPASSFFGAVSLQPAVGSHNDSPVANPKDTRTMVITVAAIIIIGYAVFHLYNR